MSTTPQESFLQGEQAFSEKNYREAESLFLQAAETGYAPAYDRLGDLYFDCIGVLRDYGKAAFWYAKTLDFSIDPTSPRDRFKAGLCYETGVGVGKDEKRAFSLYERAKDDVRGAYRLAFCLLDGIGTEKDEKKGALLLIPLAENGYANAQNALSYCYGTGEGVEESHEQEYHWARKAVAQGHIIAQNNLGVCYGNGQGVERSYEKAVEWYQKSAEQGYAIAQYNLGSCYDDGRGVEQSYEEAVKWYLKAAEQEHAGAQNNLGLCYANGDGVVQSYEEAVKWFTKAAEQEHAGAQNNLGLCYANGDGVEQSFEKAAYWWTKAAEQGDANAQCNLGICYENGDGVEQSYNQAVCWYTKAAEQGHAGAQCNLGYCYEKGQGVEQSYEEAVKWYTKAAEQGDAWAQNNLGLCYANGDGVVQSYEEAVKWYTKAVEQGHAGAQCNLGYCYYNGQGVEQSYEQAVVWYQKAAAQGHASAQNNLGWSFYKGQGAEQSYEKAVEWYTKAAEQGEAYAQGNLGWCYEYGQGVEQSYEQALYWYRKALENGLDDVREAIERLEKEQSKLNLAQKKDVFISWNHNDVDARKEVKRLLECGGITVWDSDAACVGEISEACLRAIENSQAWIVLVSENSLQSEWVKKEIGCIFRQTESDPELTTCVIPVYVGEDSFAAAQKVCKENPEDAFNRLLDLGGVYGLEKEGARVVDLVKTSLSGRKMIEYRKKTQDVSALFNAFIATRLEMSDDSAEVGLKCKMDVDYVPRTVKSKSGETLDEAAFVTRIGEVKATLLYAQGGAGKSLYLQHLLRKYFSADRYVFKTTAKALAEYLDKDPEKDALVRFFVKDVNETVGYGREVDEASFYGLFRLLHNKIFFVIDALDELGGDENALHRLREATLLAPVATESNVHFLFTSRRASDGAFFGADECYELEKFSREDGYAVAKRVFDRFAQKYRRRGGLVGADGREEKVTLSDRTLYVELDKLRDEIAANPLLVTNFVILFVDHLTSGSALPKNDYEIAEKSVAFLLKDVERDRLSVNREVDKKALDMLDGVLCDLALNRAQGDTRKTTEIFAAYLQSRKYEGDAVAEAERLLRYLRSRAIVMGDERHGNVYHAIFQAYLAAQAIYNDCYTVKRGKFGANVLFGTVYEDDVPYSGSALLAFHADTYFKKDVVPWTDVEPFLVADLDKNVFDLPGVTADSPLQETSASYRTLSDTLSCLYGTEKDRERHAYATLLRMIDARSVYNIDAIRGILGI